MKRIYLFFVMMGITCSSPLYCYDQSPACYKQIQQTFFRQDLLVAGLSLYSVNQNIWLNIYNDLQNGASSVPSIVDNLARAKNPNPLDPVFLPGASAEILQQALFSVFQGVMNKYAYEASSSTVINQNTIVGIFRYMWEQQYSLLEACIKI
ncbi:MAG: hypothetical protein H0U49_04060 [Parachlamydiaceae bacterium]|nr:hypothetical protein [Parachlamydiaceae bacterium]